MFSLSKRNRWAKKLIRTIISIFIFLTSLIVLPPLLIFICFPIYMFRFCVGKIGPIVNKNIYKIVTVRNSFVAVDEVEKSQTYFVGISGILEGDANVESVRKILTTTLIEATNPLTGKRYYPEVTSKIVKFAGFYFWGQDEEFDIKDHVKECQDPNKKEFYEHKDFVELEKKFYTTALPGNKPPWELMIVNNYREEGSKENKSLFLWKWHHIVADGHSFLEMSYKFTSVYKDQFTNCPNFEKIKFENPIETSIGNKSLFGFYLKFAFYSLYELIYTSVNSTDFNVLHPSMLKKRKPGIVKTMTKPHKAAQLKMLKEIGKANEVGMTSVIVAGITGGIRRFMMESGLKVPWKIHAGLPIPTPGHPKDKFRHYYSIISIAMPLGVSDPFVRLQKIEKKVLKCKNSTRPLFNFLILIPTIGGLFPAMIRIVNKCIYTTGILSSFPWYKDKMIAFNMPAHFYYMDLAFYPGNNPLNITTLTYNGNLSIVLTGSAETFESDENMERINELILEEFQTLHVNIV